MTMDIGVGGAAASAGVVGGLLGLLLAWAVDRWFRSTGDAGVSRRSAAVVAGVSVCAVIALWWWEMQQAGQMPSNLRAASVPAGRHELLPRFLAHLVFFWLLAAATWIDLRQRVIPDWITLPGALTGLVAAWAWPRMLLPIAVEVPRSFAAPAVVGDVLAWYGGLDSVICGLAKAAPHLAGLGVAMALFVAWWAVCTDPSADAAPGRWLSSRTILLVCALAAIGAGWWGGTNRFAALQTALVGLVASGGLVWVTRAGASRALGREAMGLGDVTLMAMAGAWLGWQACVIAFFLASFIGLAHGVVQLLRHHDNELPFGPSLCLATATVVVFWSPIWQAVAVHFEQPGQLMIVVAAVVALTAIALFLWRAFRGG